MYAETEDQQVISSVTSRLHPQRVGVFSQRHVDGAEQLFCQLEGLAVLSQERRTLYGERLAALL